MLANGKREKCPEGESNKSSLLPIGNFTLPRKTMDDDGRHLSCAVERDVNNLFRFKTQLGILLLIMAEGRCQTGTVNK